MKKNLYSSFVLILILFVSWFFWDYSYGFSSMSDELINLTVPINDDSYIAWKDIDTTTTIDGDLNIFWNNITIWWLVNQDLHSFSKTLTVQGDIEDDLIVVADTVKIFGQIKGDAIIIAREVEISNGVTIGWDMVITAQKFTFHGTANGTTRINVQQLIFNGLVNVNAIINAKEITLWQWASIKGNLTYYTNKKLSELESIVDGTSEIRPVDYSNITAIWQGILEHLVAWNIIFVSLLCVILYFSAPAFWKKVTDTTLSHPGKSFLAGFVFVVGIPFVILILTLSIVWIPVALPLFFLYWLVVLSSEIFLVLTLTYLVSIRFFNGTGWQHKFSQTLCIITLAWLSTFIMRIDRFFSLFTLWASLLLIVDSLRLSRLKN